MPGVAAVTLGQRHAEPGALPGQPHAEPGALPGQRHAVVAAVTLGSTSRASRSACCGAGRLAGLGVVPPTRAGELFRDQLGQLNQRLAAESDETVLVVAGRVINLPG